MQNPSSVRAKFQPSAKEAVRLMPDRDSSAPPPPPRTASHEALTVRKGGGPIADEEVVSAGSDLAEALVVDGRYCVKRELGRGGMGVVYLARDTWLDRPVALKVLEPTWSTDSRAAAGFLREAKALASLRSPNIVQVYTFGLHEESYFFAMEYVRGRTLRAVLDDHKLRGGLLPLGAALDILEPIARGLAVVHAAGTVHRDVKPANIIIERNTGRPVLVDFGLAASDHEGASRILIVGTPRYMAPEQAAGGARITAQSDIYALGCTTFEVLTGGPPFATEDWSELRLAHLHRAPAAVSSLRPELAPFDAVLARALAKAPDDRFKSCDAFATALLEAASNVSWTEAPASERIAR
jgi:serine/threonine protein kinase